MSMSPAMRRALTVELVQTIDTEGCCWLLFKALYCLYRATRQPIETSGFEEVFR